MKASKNIGQISQFPSIPLDFFHSRINPGHFLMSYLKGLDKSSPKLVSNDEFRKLTVG
jgi:hypothetical protein